MIGSRAVLQLADGSRVEPRGIFRYLWLVLPGVYAEPQERLTENSSGCARRLGHCYRNITRMLRHRRGIETKDGPLLS
jgi:hypothetical protein